MVGWLVDDGDDNDDQLVMLRNFVVGQLRGRQVEEEEVEVEGDESICRRSWLKSKSKTSVKL